ncbi:hypothetical protein E2C01_063464 [Portunus trituberculatus]|uniref:Uncharacterized protein n=1 Tax=Portunus trituberculatus TaxID=210409 RepID=A0A5B7HJ14_PORTR|nr:hypothetical protein [Portunus trituberculatus]
MPSLGRQNVYTFFIIIPHKSKSDLAHIFSVRERHISPPHSAQDQKDVLVMSGNRTRRKIQTNGRHLTPSYGALLNPSL